MIRPKITPCLWFDSQAHEAAEFYVSLFANSKISSTTPGPDGKPLVVEFELGGVRIMAINGRPTFKLSEAISLSVDCADQAEVDDLWEKLTADGGEPSQCGWLKDKYGLSWQIVPSILPTLMSQPGGAERVMPAVMQMVKLDVKKIQDAFDGK